MKSFSEKWVDFIKTNPDWRSQHTHFINARVKLKSLSRAKLVKLFGIKNKKLIEQL